MSRKRREQEKTGEIKGRIKSGNRKKRKHWKGDEEEVIRKKDDSERARARILREARE